MKRVSVFAPGTIANLGPAFDILGVALSGLGDLVEARENNEGVLRITDIRGPWNHLPREAEKNAATLGFLEVERMMGKEIGADIVITKGLPISGGLGGSSASAVAGVVAAHLLSGKQLLEEQLFDACFRVESALSGKHADNVAPCFFGGFVLISNYSPLQIVRLGAMENICFTVAHPHLELETKKSRTMLPKQVPLESHVFNMSKAASLISAILQKDALLFGKSIEDHIVEPARTSLIPGFSAVKKSALDAGAFGCSISGSGPSVFAVSGSKTCATEIGKAMQEAFAHEQLESDIFVSPVSHEGAKQVQ